MPHKKNPISAENLCGLARLLRSYCNPALEDIALWHERDISHSSVERLILPDATTLADYLVHRAARLVRGLRVRPERLAHNLGLGGELFGSEKVMLKLVETGLSRQAAYEKVQEHALAAVESRHGGGETSLRARLLADPEVTARLPAAELVACFDIAHHLRHVPAIFERTLAPDGDRASHNDRG
jgi:adenylosuccinate lyase